MPLTPWVAPYVDFPFYYVAFGVLLVAVFVSWWIRHSKFGLGLLAIRDDEDRALGLGVKTNAFKLTAYVISAFFVAMAGAIFAYYVGSVYPEQGFNPAVDLTEARAASGRLFADGFYLTENDRQWSTRHYFAGDERDPTDPRASPALAEDLSGLAPAIVITAGFDPLRDEGEAYAEALRKAGTRVVLDRAPELIHGFINMTTVPAAREAALRLAGMLRAGLALAK